MPVIEYSSMCLNADNYSDKIKEAKKIVEANGFAFGIQMHNSISRDLFDKILEFKNEIKLSVHSPVFARYFINLAASDFKLTKEICDENINFLKQTDTDIFFFHGFFLTDKPIVHDMSKYRQTMQQSMGYNFCLNKSFVMDPKIFSEPVFIAYKNKFVENYKKLKKLYPDFIMTIENDFIGIGSGLQRPMDILELADNLWFDLGHFWCSSLLHKFDYYEYCERIIREKNIVGVHINHNFMTKQTPKEKLFDSHGHIYKKSEQDLKPIIKRFVEKGVNILTLEILDGDINDIKTLIDWINS